MSSTVLQPPPITESHRLLPLRTVSEANAHAHWRTRQKRAKQQRFLTRATLGSHLPPLPCTVTLTRISPRELDDDNLQGALKHVRDGVADALGINDRDKRVTWKYGQEKPQQKRAQLVRIEIVAQGAEPC